MKNNTAYFGCNASKQRTLTFPWPTLCWEGLRLWRGAWWKGIKMGQMEGTASRPQKLLNICVTYCGLAMLNNTKTAPKVKFYDVRMPRVLWKISLDYLYNQLDECGLWLKFAYEKNRAAAKISLSDTSHTVLQNVLNNNKRVRPTSFRWINNSTNWMMCLTGFEIGESLRFRC